MGSYSLYDKRNSASPFTFKSFLKFGIEKTVVIRAKLPKIQSTENRKKQNEKEKQKAAISKGKGIL